MGYHSFSLDPRTVLGVGPNASLDEIRDAYRTKSKKHHPDLGGDEWAFRMVARAYEVLKTTATATTPTPAWAGPRVADAGSTDKAPDWSGIWKHPFNKPASASASAAGRNYATNGGERKNGVANGQETSAVDVNPDDEDPEATEPEPQTKPAVPEPTGMRNVDVELIWTRFEKEGSGRLVTTQEGDDATLSVCIVISWPPHDLVERAAEFHSTGETLRTLIDLFARARTQKPVVAARSRIEDGQFVGWLSYIDVLTAQDAFLALRDSFRSRGLTVKLYTRDERVPFDWYGAGHQPVMSHAS